MDQFISFMPKKKIKAEIAMPLDVVHEEAVPKQEAFYKLPARFGALPLDEMPLGEAEDRNPGLSAFFIFLSPGGTAYIALSGLLNFISSINPGFRFAAP